MVSFGTMGPGDQMTSVCWEVPNDPSGPGDDFFGHRCLKEGTQSRENHLFSPNKSFKAEGIFFYFWGVLEGIPMNKHLYNSYICIQMSKTLLVKLIKR